MPCCKRIVARILRWLGFAIFFLAVIEVLANLWLVYFTSEETFVKFASIAQIQDAGSKIELGIRLPFGLYPTPGYVKGAKKINSLGYRGDEITLPKPAGLFRIVCMGGSTTYDEEIEDNQKTYVALLGEELKRQGCRVETINAGTPGWCSRESILNYATRVQYLDPDLIIVYHGINDLLFRGLWPPEKYRSDYVVPQAPFPEFVVPRFVEYFACVRIPLIQLGIVAPPSNLANGDDPDFWGVNVASFFIQHMQGTYPQGVFQQVSLRQIFEANPPIYYENNLTTLVKMADVHQTPVVLATFAVDNISVRNDLGEDQTQFFFGLEQMNTSVRSVSEKTLARYFDFAAIFPENKEYWADLMHNTESGAAVKAQLFAKFLLEEQVIPDTFRQGTGSGQTP